VLDEREGGHVVREERQEVGESVERERGDAVNGSGSASTGMKNGGGGVPFEILGVLRVG